MWSHVNIPDWLKDIHRELLIEHNVNEDADPHSATWRSSVKRFERAACNAVLDSTSDDLHKLDGFSVEVRAEIDKKVHAERIDYAIRTIRALHVALNSMLQEPRQLLLLKKEEAALTATRKDYFSLYANHLWHHGGGAVVARYKSHDELRLYRPQHDEVRQVARRYLNAPWMHCSELDWLIVDVLMFVGIDAMYCEFYSELETVWPDFRTYRIGVGGLDDRQVPRVLLQQKLRLLRWKRIGLTIVGLGISTAVAYSLFTFNSVLAVVAGVFMAVSAIYLALRYPTEFRRQTVMHTDAITRANLVYEQLGNPGAQICPAALRDQCVALTPFRALWPSELFVLLATISKRESRALVYVPDGKSIRV